MLMTGRIGATSGCVLLRLAAMSDQRFGPGGAGAVRVCSGAAGCLAFGRLVKITMVDGGPQDPEAGGVAILEAGEREGR